MSNWLLALLCTSVLMTDLASASKNLSKIIVRTEESRWLTEVIHAAPDGWPELKARMTFPSQKEAEIQAKLFQKQNGFNSEQDLELRPLLAEGSLWPSKEAWSEEWEKRYGQWIEANVDTEFFVRYNVATDCADVAYALRWIFSRIHGLPAAAKIGGTKVLLTNETLRPEWSNLPTASEWHQDKRFRAALNYLLNMTYTHTLWDDSFPVALNRQALLSGSYHLSLRDTSGHTQVIHWLGADAGVPFLTLNSTVPRKVRSLTDSVLFASYPKDREGAILRFRWAVKGSSGMVLKKATEMPGYSLEQYSFQSDKDFTMALFEKLGFTGGTAAIVAFLYKDLYEQFESRKGIVEEGYSKCLQIDCKPGTMGWEDWGTPSRDSRILGKISSLLSITLNSIPIGNPNPYLSKELIHLENVSWDLKAVLWNWRNSHFSSDPRDTIALRWGAGYESWMEQQKNYFSKMIQTRLKHFEKSKKACQNQDCSFGKAAWESHSSNKIDMELGFRIQYLSSGHVHLPKSILALLNSQSQLVLGSVADESLTLAHFLNFHKSMNSSPTATVESQWALRSQPLMQLKSSMMTPYFDQWLLDTGHWQLYDRNKGQLIPIEGRILGAFAKSPVLLIGLGSRYELWHLKNGQRIPLPEQLQQNGIQFRTPNSGHLLSQTSEGVHQVWSLNESSLTLTPAYQLEGPFWNILTGDFLTNYAGHVFDLAHLKLFEASPVTGQVFSNQKVLAYFDHRTRQAILWDRLRELKTQVPLSGSEWISYFSPDGQLIMTTGMSESKIYRIDSNLNLSEPQIIKGYCQYIRTGSFQCFTQTGILFYQYIDGEISLVDSERDWVWFTDSYIARRAPGNLVQLFDRKNNQLLFSAQSIEYINDFYIAAKTQELGQFHIVDLRNPKIALFTNLFSHWNASSLVEKNGDWILTGARNFSESVPILWKRKEFP